MHIGFFSDQHPPYPQGGVGARVTDLAHGLVRAGHAVTVSGIYSRNRGVTRLVDETLDGVRVVRIPQSPLWMRWRPGILWDRYQVHAQFRRLHLETPFDLIEITDGRGIALFGVPPRVPLAIRMDGTMKVFDDAMGIDGDRFYYWMERTALRKADFLSAPSSYARDATMRLFGLNGRECTVIHNAVDTELFSPGPIPAETGLIVSTNSIEPRKGMLEMVAAMNVIGESHPHARLVLIGSDTQPRVGGRSYSERLLDVVRPEFRDRITFTGRLDRHTAVLDYLRKAHVCCYPCRIETFGIAPLEAMAVGKPVIYGNTGPGPELIEDGVSGLLCEATSPNAIAAAIKRIFDEPLLAQKLARGARERAVAMFSKDAWIQRNIDYYGACIASYRERRR
jgi:glycosyltransferase involved in cell wall biosynthesis